MEINLFIHILLIHFLADFVLQTHDQAQKKSEGENAFNVHLFYHTLTYTFIWAIWFLSMPFMKLYFIIFVLGIGIPHYFVDWCTSRISKPLFQKGDYHNGFVVVGADQLIHYVCLYYWINLFI